MHSEQIRKQGSTPSQQQEEQDVRMLKPGFCHLQQTCPRAWLDYTACDQISCSVVPLQIHTKHSAPAEILELGLFHSGRNDFFLLLVLGGEEFSCSQLWGRESITIRALQMQSFDSEKTSFLYPATVSWTMLFTDLLET